MRTRGRDPRPVETKTPEQLAREQAPELTDKPERVQVDRPTPPDVSTTLGEELVAAFRFYLRTIVKRGARGEDVDLPLPTNRSTALVLGGLVLVLAILGGLSQC